MKIIKVKEQEIIKNPHNAEVRKLYENDNLEMMHIILKPGEHLIKHSLAVDALFYVLEGSGKFETDDRSQDIEKDILIESPANVPRGWLNDSRELLKILVIKTPKPSQTEKREAISEIFKNKK